MLLSVRGALVAEAVVSVVVLDGALLLNELLDDGDAAVLVLELDAGGVLELLDVLVSLLAGVEGVPYVPLEPVPDVPDVPDEVVAVASAPVAGAGLIAEVELDVSEVLEDVEASVPESAVTDAA